MIENRRMGFTAMHGVLGPENGKWEMDKGSLVYPGYIFIYIYTFSRSEKRTGYRVVNHMPERHL
jgi:hypothetical protein